MAEGRHATSSTRKPAIWIGAGVAAVAVLVVVLLVTNGNGGGLGGIVPGIGADQPKTPAFSWDAAKPVAVTTKAMPDGADEQQGAEAASLPAAKAAEKALDDLYTQAFLVPQNWQDGNYDDAVSVFAKSVQGQAEKQLKVLTAGTGVGDVLDTIDPKSGTLKTQVLLGPEGTPYSVLGTVRFTATGKGADTKVTFASTGEYFLQKIDGEWRIVAFDVTRNDREKSPKPSGAGATGTASGGTTPTGEPS